MATSPTRPTPSDAEILEARRRSNEAVIRLLHSWENEGDPEEQRETLAYLDAGPRRGSAFEPKAVSRGNPMTRVILLDAGPLDR